MTYRKGDDGQENVLHLMTGREVSSESEDGLDIVKSTKKSLSLDLSQYINALTQSQTQSQDVADGDASSRDHDGVADPATTRSNRDAKIKAKVRRTQNRALSIEERTQSSESDWSFQDGEADYLAYKNRSTLKRKRAAKETNRIRAQKKSRAASARSIVGRRHKVARPEGDRTALSAESVAEDAMIEETYLDEPIPQYLEARRRHLKKLHNAGLRVPPDVHDIELLEANLEAHEKPRFDAAIRPQRAKKDIKLKETGAIIPASLAQWLRDYQLQGVEFLHEKFVRQTGAILGDDMGLGKTIQVIAFLTAAFGKSGKQHDAKLMRSMRRYAEDRWYPKVLIVCPGTLMRNWEDELEKWGWWEVHKYHGNPADRRGVLGAAKKGMLEIMITTYDTYRGNESEINTVEWDCVIADECHQIKNKNAEITKAMNNINALCRIGLTGTAIQNKYEELWNLLNWARPGAYGSAQEWKQMISLPLKMGQAHGATFAQLADARSKAQELVHGILPSVFLRRMKTLIAHQLPKKSDRVVFCQLTYVQADAYRAFIESDKCEFIRTAKEPCDCGSGKTRGWCCYVEIPNEGKWAKFMFPCMVTLQKLANHLALLLPVSTDLPEKQAKDLDNLQIACPDNWRDLYRIRDSILQQSQREFCGKWKVLKRLLDFWHSNGDKVLVFSHSVRLLRLLKTLFDLDGTKFNFSYLDGSMTYEERSAVVADFNSDPNQFVFLISTRAGGVGLNITSANKVVVVDPNWNPAYDLQAQDRAYRIGQTRDVEVFRLVSSGTIEEIVYARQIYKQQQANIGYTASEERRYFRGVMDQSEKKGELFGLENLFTFQEDNVLLRDIMHKTNVAETRSGVNAVSCNFEESQYEDDDNEILSNKSLGLPEEDVSMTGQMKRMAESFTTEASNEARKKASRRANMDPINAILAKAGVQYTHENSEVIGRSEVEARLGKQALELRNDVDLGAKRVFAGSQSQLQPSLQYQLGHSSDLEYSSHDDGVELLGSRIGKDLMINYRYRPSEAVRSRQFCEMSQNMGYKDPIAFALVVEGLTQEERRRMLERFYRSRRADIERDTKDD